ncbi:MAG: hypothetical protein JWQ38_1877 [Flavipsychrobacter sp.]|nr:hypothetical protein [Flavipsychrobacter sp.]
MKHTIKTILTSAMATIATFFMVVYISCSKDKCASVSCVNGGSCSGGKCNCPSSYEGDKCETAATAKFIRNWGANNETASVAEPANFPVSISEGDGVSGVTINNLHNYFTKVSATITRDSIVIPLQTIQGKTVVGAGYIFSSSAYGINNTISISYTVTDVVTHKTDNEVETWNG